MSNDDTDDDVTSTSDTPGALLRLRHPVRQRNFNDTSGMGPGDDVLMAILVYQCKRCET